MLRWWWGIYDHVFVAPHPFFRLRANGTKIGARESQLEAKLRPDERPDDFYDVVKRRAETVSWREVHHGAAPEEPQEKVYRAIWLLSCIGFQERADVELQKRIDAYCDDQRLYLPEDDYMPAALQPRIGQLLARFRIDSVTAWDEWNENSTELPLSAFDSPQPDIYLAKGRLHLPQPGVLITWKLDSTEALIAMTERARSQGRPEELFEGWYVDETAYCDVFNPRDFLDRDQRFLA